MWQAAYVMCNHKDHEFAKADMPKEEQIIKLLDTHELTRERVVSKLMLDMVCLVEAIHFDRDGSMHLRNEITGRHDGSMTPDV